MEYRIIRSNRKTLAIQIKNGQVIVRAPLQTEQATITDFLEKHKGWIDKHLEESEQLCKERENIKKLTAAELHRLALIAKGLIPQRVAYYAKRIGVTYGNITIRCQKSRWGSCSSRGNLNFNCLLMLAPSEVIDSVVVHELCHRKHMNHSEAFYSEVFRAFPDYKKWNQWLKENGKLLMMRLPE